MECNVLGLYGPENSEYLHLVERRAENIRQLLRRVEARTGGAAVCR